MNVLSLVTSHRGCETGHGENLGYSLLLYIRICSPLSRVAYHCHEGRGVGVGGGGWGGLYIQMVCLLHFVCVYVAQEQRAVRTQRYPHVPNVSFFVCLRHCDAVRNVQNLPGRLGYFPHSFRIQLPWIFFPCAAQSTQVQ